MRSSLLLLLLAALVGCSGSSKPIVAPKKVLPPVDPAAVEAFQSGLQTLSSREENWGEARQQFQRAVKLDPNLWEAWHNLGVVYFALGEDDEAATSFSRALEINPRHRASLLARAEAYRRSGSSRKARADYEKALTSDPEDRATGARLASLLREKANYDDALDRIRETLRVVGASAQIYVELGLIYLAQNRLELAELVFRKAAELDPKEPAIYNAVALLALERGNAQLAFNRFDQATALDPDYLAARFNKAAVLLDAGDYASARAELQMVIDRGPKDSSADFEAMVALGVAYRGLQEYDQAKATWERVVKAAPKHAAARGDALYNLAILEMDFLENMQAAVEAFQQYLATAPPDHPKRASAEEKLKELGQ